MNARYVLLIIAVVTAACLPAAANAAFYTDTDTLISGKAPFFSSASQLYGYVDYAVYAPGNFTGSDSYPDKYFYCYQIFNSPTSSSISRYTVNLEAGETTYSPGDFVFSEGDINPSAVFTSPTTIAYLFTSRNQIAPNNNSSVLFFAADYGSITNSVIITGTITGSVSIEIPPPVVPEPASLLLLSLGLPILLKIRRRKS